MKKIIKILIGLTVLFALLMLTITYLLKPSDRLKNDDRLWNVSDNVDIDSYNREVLGNISLDKGKLVSEIKIDDYIKRKDLTLREIDLKIGLLDTDGVDKRTALFKAGTEPVEYEGKFK